MKGSKVTVLSLIVSSFIISGFLIYILFDENKRCNKKIDELEKEIAANKAELEAKIEHESLVYE